ncbi:MAG: glycosyltransferase [Solirubrobacterales bacterium]|nr:glycosyltransferase [Solirubrobacterales bacterium]
MSAATGSGSALPGPRAAGAPKGRIIVFGIAFWFPLAGVTFQFLHYLLGLRRLGWDVYYVEDSGRWVYDPWLNDRTPDASRNVAAVAPILEQHGFAGRWAFRGAYDGGRCYGMSEQELLRLYREADAFLNVTASQELREEHLACPRRIYVESDPFPVQVRAHAGDAETLEALARHDTHFSFGENLGAPDCLAPNGTVRWLPTRQPVVTDLWDAGPPANGHYTTITTWHNKGKDIEYNGDRWYWTKDREFVKHLDLPARTGVPFRIAVGEAAHGLLAEHGWQSTSSLQVSRDMDAYRAYICSSRAEFTVARDQYVRPRTGWFSDRSACYLAAGRPVITEETAFSKFLPTGEGLFAFSSTDDAAAAIEAVESNYARHSRAAREVAREHFAAERVLASLLERAGL